MAVSWNTEFAEWARNAAGKRSLRQIEIRSGVSHSTIRSMLDGRAPQSETVIRFASAFDQSIPDALDLAGYSDLAELWRTGAAPQQFVETREREPDADAPEILELWTDFHDGDQKSLLDYARFLKANREKIERGELE